MRPKPGSIYGELGQHDAIGIGGKNSRPPTYIIGTSGQEFKNVDIAMFEVPIPDVKRKETEVLVKADKYSKENLSEDLPLRKKTVDTAVESTFKPDEKKKN